MDYEVIEKEAFQVVGIRRTAPSGGGTWGIVKSDGSLERINRLGGGRSALGLCFGFDDKGNDDYMVCVEYDGQSPPGFDAYRCPKALWLSFEARGSISQGILGNTWRQIYEEALPRSGYRKTADIPTMEKYIEWDEANDLCRVGILIPVER